MRISPITNSYNTSNINFNGDKGDKFLNTQIPYRNYLSRNNADYNKIKHHNLRLPDTNDVVKNIKDEYGINSNKSDDILQALIKRIKDLTLTNCAYAEKIDSLENENNRLTYLNNSLERDVASAEQEARYWRHMAK